MRVLDLHALCVSLSVLCASCDDESGAGGTGSPSTTPASAAQVEDLCAAQCDRSARCGTGDPLGEEQTPECVDSCAQDLGPLGENVRADFLRQLTDCTSNLECGTNDDVCMDRAIVVTGESIDAALHTPEVQDCLRKQDECAGTEGSFSDDQCGALLFLIDGARAQAAACFGEPCGELSACLEPIFGP